jgi:quinol monooxygenase YgiN
MTGGEYDVSREDREERKTKEEVKDPGPLKFLPELVKEEDLSPEVDTSYRKLAQTMTNQFRQEMRSCITFVRVENQAIQDMVTERMKDVAEAFKNVQEEHMKETRLEMENLQVQLCGLEDQLQQRSGTLSHCSKGPKPLKPN